MNDLDVARAVADRLKDSITFTNVIEISSLDDSGDVSIKIAADDYTISRINASMGKVVTVNIEMGDTLFELRAFVTNVMTEVGVGPDGAHHFITVHLTLIKEDEIHGFTSTVAAAKIKQKNYTTVWRNSIH